MKVNIYSVKDEVLGEHVFTFEAVNDGMMKRAVESFLLTKEHNPFNTNIKDKIIYLVGERETIDCSIVPCQVTLVARVADIRLDLIKQIKAAKAEAGDQNPTAAEVVDDE